MIDAHNHNAIVAYAIDMFQKSHNADYSRYVYSKSIYETLKDALAMHRFEHAQNTRCITYRRIDGSGRMTFLLASHQQIAKHVVFHAERTTLHSIYDRLIGKDKRRPVSHKIQARVANLVAQTPLEDIPENYKKYYTNNHLGIFISYALSKQKLDEEAIIKFREEIKAEYNKQDRKDTMNGVVEMILAPCCIQ